MKRIRFRRVLAGLLLACLCAGASPAVAGETAALSVDIAAIAAQAGMAVMMESDALAFCMDAATTQFMIIQKDTGTVFRSNPVDWDSNPVMRDDVLVSDLGSIFLLTYYDEASGSYTMNTHRDSVILEQFDIEQVSPATTAVHYIVGPDESDGILPNVVLEETFAQYVFDSEALTDIEKMEIKKSYRLLNETEIMKIKSQTDRDKIYAMYPHVREEPVYELRTTTNNVTKKRLKEYMLRTELTLDILAADLERIEPEEGSAKKPTFYITVEYTLDGGDLLVRIPSESFASPEHFYLSNIQLLKYFGTVPIGDTGEIFIPDGSGAIIRTENLKPAGMTSLSLSVYGSELVKDMSLAANTSGIVTNPCLMPVYGISSEMGGLFAVIEKGEAIASILTNSATQAFAYNCVSPSFTVLPRDYVSFGSTRRVSFSYIFPKTPVSEDIQIRYMTLPAGESGYVDMAKAYRGYMQANGTLTPLPEGSAYPMLVEFFGGIIKKQSVFGVPVNRVLPLTPYADVQSITGMLLDDGIEGLRVRMNAWSNDGYQGTYNKSLTPIGTLGGRKDFVTLTAYMQANGVPFYPDIDLLYVGEDRLLDGFRPSAQASRTIVQKTATANHFDPVTNTSTQREKSYLISPAQTLATLQGALSDAQRLGISAVSLGEYGQVVASDYRRGKEVMRTDALQMGREYLAQLKADGYGLLLDGGLAAYLSGADFLANVPLSDSMFKAVDHSVPFLSIVLHGFVNYTGISRNNADDMQRALLLTAESGAGLGYTWMSAEESLLVNTMAADMFYSANYRSWYDDAVAQYARYARVFGPLQGQTIEDHILHTDTLRETVYEGGGRVLVNYGTEAARVGGVTVPAGDFVYVEAKEGQ